jgi:integrase/recombinase XerD
MCEVEELRIEKKKKLIKIETRECIIHDKKRIALLFKYDEDVITLVKQIEGRRWSASNKFWHIPVQEHYLEALNRKFSGKVEFIRNATDMEINKTTLKLAYEKALKELRDQLTAKRYSESTITVYTDCLRKFFQHFADFEPQSLTDEQVKEYVLFLLREKKISFSKQKQVISAIKFYFEKIPGRDTKKYYFEIPKSNEKKLPIVLSKEEVKRILDHTNNLKHKAILSTIYSAGLRLSEVVNLKIADIDSVRKLIYIRGGKGKKDRATILSTELLELLRKYFKKFRPKIWLFEGKDEDQYSKRGVQEIFYTSLQKSKIDKKASVHTLRHSFATHLLEGGEDLRYIQKVLGHKNSKTTEIYTNITKKGISKITNPLDEMDLDD